MINLALFLDVAFSQNVNFQPEKMHSEDDADGCYCIAV